MTTTTEQKISRVLLVEDNADQAALVEEYVQEFEGHPTLKWVATLEQAYEACECDAYDVVLLDLGLERSKGLETLEEAVTKLRFLPIVVLTAQSEASLGEHAIQVGAQDYLQKIDLDGQCLWRSIRYAVQRKQHVTELARKTEDLELITRAASHDLLGPARRVRTFTEFLLADTEDYLKDGHVALAQRIWQSSTQLHDRLEGLFRIAQLGYRNLRPEPVELGCLLSEVIHHVEGGGECEFTVGELPTVEGDHVLLISLFQNLIQNALKYRREEQPRVKIEGTRGTAYAHVSVQDNGRGIASDDFERVFAPFEQLVKGSEFFGAGLGLAIVRRIVDLHKGEISVESTVGEGTTFRIKLPLAREDL